MAEIVDFGLQQHKIKMDGRYFENVLSVVAGDTGRRIEVQLLDTNGMVQDTTGLNLRLNAEIAGKATFTDATLVDATIGKYQLDLSNGMFLAPGNWQFQWLITDSAGKKLHSFAFTGNVGSNISEGGSQATNFYLNLEDLKAMQEDLVNGTIDSSILETNITEKLTDLETQYAPKLTEVTARLSHKAEQVQVDALEMRTEDVIQSANLDPNKDQELVDARFGKATLAAKIRDVDKMDSLFENKLFDVEKKRDYSGQTSVGSTNIGATRIIREKIPMGTLVLSLNVEVDAPGQMTIKAIRLNSDNTVTNIGDVGISNVNTGKNTIILNYHTNEEVYIGIYTSNARFAYANIAGFSGDLTVTGELTGTSTATSGAFNMFASLAITTATTKIEKNLNETINAEIEELRSELGQPSSVFLYSNNLMQIFPENTAIGDSLVAGFTNANGANMGSVAAAQTKNNWPGFLALRTGRSFTNIAVGGSTARDWRNTHVLKADVKTDCYWIALGVNDLRGTLSIGTPSDISADRNNNADTFYGNYDYVVRQSMSYNPNARAFVFTIPPHEGVQAVDYNVAIRHVASLYDNVHLIDLHEIYYEEYTTGFLPNNFINGHYTPLTYNYISTLIEKAVNDYIFNNYDNFITVPYV